MKNKQPWSDIGGHPIVDLLNTVAWRLDPSRRRDDLGSLGDVVDWCRANVIVTGGEAHDLTALAAEAQPRRQATALQDFRALREHLYEAIWHHDDSAVRLVVDVYRRWLDGVQLAPAGAAWTWQTRRLDLDLPRQRVAERAVALLTDPALERLGQCHDTQCGWLFLDFSPRRNRQWCDPADCGNRNRVRAHYRRTTARPA